MCDDDNWMELPPPVKRPRGILGLRKIQVHSNVRMMSRQAVNMDEDSLPESLPPTPATNNLITDDEAERTPLPEEVAREEAVTPVLERPIELPRVNDGTSSSPAAAGRTSPALGGKNLALLADMPRASPMSEPASSSDGSDYEDNVAESLAERICEERICREAFRRVMGRGMRQLERLRQKRQRGRL